MNFIERLKAAESIYIYGAGAIGKRVYSNLLSPVFGFQLAGYVVTDASQYMTSRGLPALIELDDLEIRPGMLIVISLSEKFHKEVISALKEKGISDYLIWKDGMLNELWSSCEYSFDDRRRGNSKVCFVLAGYKEFLWENVFGRLKKFVPQDVEVCILSSGKKVEELVKLAEEYDWSYLSTSINDITLIQNIALGVFKDYEWIYKMDEDIFLTENCFEKMMSVYQNTVNNEPYDVGYVAPLIPVNSYGYIQILKKLNKLNEYEERFEKAVYGGEPKRMIENNYHAAEFMWGYGGHIPKIDELNNKFAEIGSYSVCGVRFSIGFILFHRSIWEDMGTFSVSGMIDLGVDEVELCEYCIASSNAMIIAENTVVGHFSFGKQTQDMKKLYETHQELFLLESK